MRWFKHDTDASRSEGVDRIEKEFGIWGYAAWFKMLERIAEKMDASDRCYAEYPEKTWAILLRTKPKILRTFLEYCENILGIKVERSGNIIRIYVPKLLRKRDNYTKDLQAKSARLASSLVSVSPSISNSNSKSSSSNPNKERKKKKLSADFELTEALRAYVMDHGILEPEPFFEEWKTYWMGRGDARLDWSKTFMSWVLQKCPSNGTRPLDKHSQAWRDREGEKAQKMMEELEEQREARRHLSIQKNS